MPDAISIKRVNKRFGATHAVRDLDLSVPEGTLCGFLGPNGAGKSTTIRMIMSIIYPDSGSIEVLGSSALSNKDRIGYLPEERGLYRKMRVGDFLAYIARLKGLPRGVVARTVESWLSRIELNDVARKRCDELSKGMQQKVQFLAAVIHEPELVILDEPFSGLDPVNSDLLESLILELHRKGRTIIYSTHVLHQAEKMCDRIFLINHGRKLLDATMDEINDRFDPRTIVVEPLDGLPRLDGLPGVAAVHSVHGDRERLELELEAGADPQAAMRGALALAPVRSIRLRKLSLEEVFIRIVRQDEGEAAAARAQEALTRG